MCSKVVADPLMWGWTTFHSKNLSKGRKINPANFGMLMLCSLHSLCEQHYIKSSSETSIILWESNHRTNIDHLSKSSCSCYVPISFNANSWLWLNTKTNFSGFGLHIENLLSENFVCFRVHVGVFEINIILSRYAFVSLKKCSKIFLTKTKS